VFCRAVVLLLLLCVQAVALLLPRFVRHMPPSVRAMVLPGQCLMHLLALLCVLRLSHSKGLHFGTSAT
jgi:hypothetical protein